MNHNLLDLKSYYIKLELKKIDIYIDIYYISILI